MTIGKIIFVPGGDYIAFTWRGIQIPAESGTAWFAVLQDQLDRGVIIATTQIVMDGWAPPPGKQYWTVQDLIKRGSLKAPEKA